MKARVNFYPSDDMLARVLAMALCLSVCVCVGLSQVGVLSKRLNESGWFFGVRASFYLSYSVFQGNSGTLKNKDTSPWNFAPDSGLRFRHSMSIVEACYQLSSRKVDSQSVTNWAVVGQLS